MFKKAKLYSLLTIFVASTVVGLFGITETVYAAADATWTAGRQNESITYGDEVCVKNSKPAVTVKYINSDNDKDFGFGDKVVFVCSEPDGSPTSTMIYFGGEVGDTAYYATFNKTDLNGTTAYRYASEKKISFDPSGENTSDPSTEPPALPTADTAVWSGPYAPGDPLSIINYNNEEFRPADTENVADLLKAGGVPDDAVAVYVAKETTDSGGNKEVQFVYFPAGTDMTNAESAVYVIVRTYSDGNVTTANQPIKVDASTAGTEIYTSGEQSSGCQIKGIGWFICPIVNFLGEVTDASYALLDSTLLRLEPIALPGSENANKMQLYTSWKAMRDFANIIFIIGFLIIIFSQITSIGIGNYGIKRLLPKIIVAAILVNLSYFICIVAVDLSNVIGNSLRGLIEGTPTVTSGSGPFSGNFFIESSGGRGTEGDDTEVGSWTELGHLIIGGGGAIAGTVLVGASMYAFLPIFLPMIISAAVAVFTVVVALAIRQALIVILVVISPLAFVALLLPNTEGYFQKWRSLFMVMLLVYPIVSIVFGASALASRILMGTNEFPVQLIGAGVSVIPLFITPIIMKASGGLLNRFVGIVNDPSKGWIDSKRNALKEQGDVIAAGRKARGITRTGRFVSGSGGVFGGANSRRRRAASFFTSYGEKTRKDALDAGESSVEGAYLGTEGGREARNAAANAKIAVQNAQLNADTVRLESPDGIQLQRQSTDLETKKQTAENRAQTDAINSLSYATVRASEEAKTNKQIADNDLSTRATNSVSDATLTRLTESDLSSQMAKNDAKTVGLEGASTDLRVQAATSAEDLSVAEAQGKQAFEEAVAGVAAAGVSPMSVADAQNARTNSNVTTSATESARNVSQQQFAEEVTRDPALATEMGGVDKYGASRATARATATIDKAVGEAIENEKKTMSRIQAIGDPKKGIPGLDEIAGDPKQSAERRAAAAGMIGKTGGTSDIMEAWTQLGDAMRAAVAAGDAAEIENVKLMQQQFMADGGNKLPASITGKAKGQMSRGTYEGTTEAEILQSFNDGAYSGDMLSGLHPKELAKIADVLSANIKTLDPAKVTSLKGSITGFKSVATGLGRGLSDERDAPISRIESL